VHDLRDLPLPFGDASLDEIVCKDVLEHLDEYIPLLREFHRMLAPGGRLHIRAPHFLGRTRYLDPTHKHAFSIDTFRFFVTNDKYAAREYYFDFHFSACARTFIDFDVYRQMIWNRVVRRVVNIRPSVQEYYESTLLSRLFPPTDVEVTLIR
jgi:SAM-dependent methyltransferase